MRFDTSAPVRARTAGPLVLAVALALAACTGDHVQTPTGPDPASVTMATAPLPALIEEPIELAVPTYENSGQSVHPDVVEFPEGGWHGARYWLSMTPYPRSDSKLENPSILVSATGTDLTVPDGLRNPVVSHSGKPDDYNSDPELVYEPVTDRLVLFYRFVDKKTNTILVTSSKDGRTWTKEPKVFWTHGHGAVSPTVTPRADGQPARMWYVNAGGAGCKTTASRVMLRTASDTSGRLTGARWSDGVPTDLMQPGYVVWHMKVRYVPSKGEYWAVYAAFPQGGAGCDVDDLFFARSVDGVHWQSFAEPLLRHEDRAWTAAALYRSSFLYDPATDEMRVWVSARGDDAKWRMGLARFRYRELIGALSNRVAITPPAVTPHVAHLALSSGESP